MREIILVGIGGFVGSALRFAISRAMLPIAAITHFPWYTLLVNVLGSFLAGMLVASNLPERWYYLSVVGFCGGFTTFSMFSFEAFRMIRIGDAHNAAIYVAASVVLCLLAVAGGFFLIMRYNN